MKTRKWFKMLTFVSLIAGVTVVQTFGTASNTDGRPPVVMKTY